MIPVSAPEYDQAAASFRILFPLLAIEGDAVFVRTKLRIVVPTRSRSCFEPIAAIFATMDAAPTLCLNGDKEFRRTEIPRRLLGRAAIQGWPENGADYRRLFGLRQEIR